MNMMLAVSTDPRFRPILSAMKPTASIPTMIPAICVYDTDPMSCLLQALYVFQHSGYAAVKRAARKRKDRVLDYSTY